MPDPTHPTVASAPGDRGADGPDSASSYTRGVSSPDYQPYQGGPFRWRLGLHPLELDDWIQIDECYDRDVAVKRQVLRDHHETAVVLAGDVVDESTEVLDALVDHLRVHVPERFGDVEPDRSVHPLDAAGRLVQEDLVLLVERGGRLVVGGGSVCFPNRWDLRSKLGLPLADVHAPVARLNAELGDPIDRFLERLTPQRSFWRLGWGVLDTDDLYQPLDGTAARPRDPGIEPGGAHLRVERETLRRFPRTRCVLFTIRTYLTSLGAIAVRPYDAARLAEALDALPDDVAAYKQLDALGPRVAAWLRTRQLVHDGGGFSDDGGDR
jgi:Haem-dependent oxidative N-demethylase, alpha subunit-like